MTDTEQSRIDQLEKDVEALKIVGARRSTPVIAVAGIVALLAFIGLIVNLPLPSSPALKERLGIGLAAGYAGAVITALARGFAKFALRALVEIAVVTVVFLNAAAVFVVWTSSAYLSELVSSWKIASGDSALPAAVALAVCTMFVIDVGLMLVLYPLAQTAGSDVLE